MASMTIYCSATAWGSSSYNNTNNVYAGKTGSTSSDGTLYRARATFPTLDKNIVIKSIRLYMNRTDAYAAHTLNIGSSASNAWGATRDWSTNISVSSGANAKNWDITAYASTLQSYSGTWYIHILHGSGTNSYSEFTGTSTSTSRPRLVIEYEYATVYYRVGGVWRECLVYYRTGGVWQQCIPYYRIGGVWRQV